MKKPALLSLIRIPPLCVTEAVNEYFAAHFVVDRQAAVCRGSAMGGAEQVGHQKRRTP